MEAGPVRNTSPGTATAVAMTKPIAPPRPPNAWILYRSDKLKELPPVPPGERRAQSDVSRLISSMWKQETDATRQFYERLADERKQEHSAKYPGYRFQPMKKEEKAAIREQKKVDKEVVRKARQQRGRQSQQPQYPELPQQQVQVFAPMSFLQPIPYAPLLQFPSPPPPPSPPPSSLYPPRRPGSVYYPMELYGPAGPSPPASLACTPAPQPSLELPPEDPEEIQLSQPRPVTPPTPLEPPAPPSLPLDAQPAAASSLPRTPALPNVNPYLALLGPTATQYSNVQHTSVPTYANSTLPAAMPNMMPSTTSNIHASLLQLLSQHQYPTAPGLTYAQPSATQEQTGGEDALVQNTDLAGSDVPAQNVGYANDSTADVFDYESLQFPSFENQQLSFNVGADFFQGFSNHQEGGSSGGDALEAIRLGNDVFQLPHFDASLLDVPPQGGVSVELGQFGDEFDFSSFIDTGMLDQGPGPGTSDSFEQTQLLNDSVELEPLPQHIFDLIQASLESVDHSPSTASFSSMPPTPVVGPGALSVDLSNTEPCQRSHAHYAPPSGAPQYATRRVAGSWKPPQFLEHEDYQQQPVRSPIGVSQ